MNGKQPPPVIRRPRHDAKPDTGCRTWIELPGRKPPAERPARLVNLSRNGLQIAIREPLAPAELLVVHIEGERERLNVALSATVRWQQLGEDGTWAVGCAVTEPIGYEVMGELFLSGILDMG